MRVRRKAAALLGAALLVGSFAAVATADDGYRVSKSMSHDGSLKGNTVPENEHAFIKSMSFYVPTQRANGTVEPVEYLNIDEALVETREAAKPLIGAYINGEVEHVDGVGFVGHGTRDAYGAISLDDGETWKNTNLSESAEESSSDVVRKDVKLFMQANKGDPGAYPGDVVNIFHAVAGDKVMVAWPSRYCTTGQPNYSLENDTNLARRDAIASYLGIDLATASADDLYLIDMYGVGGQQGSVDYAEDKFPQNQVVGEVPFSCLWTARGQIIPGDDPRTEAAESSYMRWFKAERLTSGRRDVNRVEVQAVEGAGFAVTWQEDPEGLRGGQGLGPGEGWSGAVANSQTDIWYSYLDWENFDIVQDFSDATVDMTLEEYVAIYTEKPKPFVPFAMPMRMTDNAKCNTGKPQPYCYGSALSGENTSPTVSPSESVVVPEFPAGEGTTPMDYGLKDMCADIVEIASGREGGSTTQVCVPEFINEDGGALPGGVPLVGNVASTRARLNLHGYDSDGDEVVDGAYAVVVAEESKGLGNFGFTDVTSDPDAAVACDPETTEGCIPFDIGKNIWYHTFDMSLPTSSEAASPATAAGDQAPESLMRNLASHGNQLNQPEVAWDVGEFYEPRDTGSMWDFTEDYNYLIYNTEIARRGSLLTQGIAAAEGSSSGLIALPTWKQGQMNQGGPADVMSRRITLEDWSGSGNPYTFTNMACDSFMVDPGVNPNYPDGLCADSAINMSSAIPDTCTDSEAGGDVTCPQVDLTQGTTFGIGDTNPILQGQTGLNGEDLEPNKDKVLSWHQCPAEFTSVTSDGAPTSLNCETDARTDDSTLADQSWYNPLDVAKGHRGFLDGDFVMMLYGWSPNWRLNTKGNDRYELYIRRSFDGAETWTTLPGAPDDGDGGFVASDGVTYAGEGTTTCETWRSTETGEGGIDEPQVCNEYAAGAAEQARNVTQLKSMRFTTLDPRYAKTAPTIPELDPELLEAGFLDAQHYTQDSAVSEDIRDPSRYFIVYETGDNTTTAEGEPEPLDLFYSRAISFGDHYQVWAEEDDLSVCYPSDPHGVEDVSGTIVEGSGFCNEFDQLEQGKPGLEASEASLAANPGGEFMYAAWAQALVDDSKDNNKNKDKSELVESDAMARRVWWIDGYISSNPDLVWTLPGTNTGS